MHQLPQSQDGRKIGDTPASAIPRRLDVGHGLYQTIGNRFNALHLLGSLPSGRGRLAAKKRPSSVALHPGRKLRPLGQRP